jgi:diadenylate cyclase
VSWRELLDLLTWIDLADIALVAILFYNLLLLIRGTRAVPMLLGLLAVVGVYQLAKLVRLRTLETIIENFFLFLPFAAIVLFQDEIRRALANIGRNPLLGRGVRRRVATVLDDVVEATATLAARKVGALVVFERQEGLRDYVERGVKLDAAISAELLVNLFTPDTPLHDGALVVRGERIAAAGCFLPLASDPDFARGFGSRHRAALGISEQTDAVAIVVSEETGEISMAIEGRLVRDLDQDGLRAALHRALLGEPRRAEAKR